MEHVHSIPGKLVSSWDDKSLAMIDTWERYFVTLAEFKDAIMQKGVTFARAHGARAWIVDSSAAKGAFAQEIQDYIASDVFKKFAEIGIKYFVTINSASTVTNLTIKSYKSQAGPAGIQLVEVASVDQAITWLVDQRAKAA
jgi:argininosuccinate lyase